MSNTWVAIIVIFNHLWCWIRWR